MLEPYIHEASSWLVLFSAVAADIALGDGDSPLHPVRIMGAAISWGEKRATALFLPKFQAGLLMSMVLPVLTFSMVKVMMGLTAAFSHFLCILFSVLCVYFSLCLRCLADEAMRVLAALSRGDLDLARKRLSMLVSRQTQDMDETAVSRAVIETVSENFVDGICSPYFYAVIGGPALCLCFKMISTMDSMIGYRNIQYEEFGKAAARMDDAANFLPARIALLIIALAGRIWNGKGVIDIIRQALKDSTGQKSPNSGLPEAAFAHVLGVNLGGPAVYDGVLSDSPRMNGQARVPVPADIKEAVRLLYRVSLILYCFLPMVLFLLLSW